MTIALNRLLAHMSWANQKTIAHLQTLPEQSLSAFATNPKWQVSEIIHHIVDSADAYAFRITGKHPQLPGDSIPEIGVIADLALIAKQAAAIDAALLEAVSLVLKDGVQPFSLKPSTTQQSTELKSHQHLKQRDLPQLI